MRISRRAVEGYLESLGAQDLRTVESGGEIGISFDLLVGHQLREGWVSWSSGSEGAFLLQAGVAIAPEITEEDLYFWKLVPDIDGTHLEIRDSALVWAKTDRVDRAWPFARQLFRLLEEARTAIMAFDAVMLAADGADYGPVIFSVEPHPSRFVHPGKGVA